MIDGLFDGPFAPRTIDLGEVRIHASVGGAGPPLLLLHGYPQTRAMWHRVAPALAARHTVVAADLRGYGDSDKPAGAADHSTYSKRTMAADMVEVMRRLGHERFAVAGHDRGARVTHRMVRDHPESVTRAAVLDIVPTRHPFEHADQAFATVYWHWFFLIQPGGLPERMIGADPEWFLRELLDRWSGTALPIDARATAEYLRCFCTPEAIRASCEDYRAAASIDLEHDRSDGIARIAHPLLVLWGAEGRMGRMYDVLATWREVAADVRGRALPCGHFVAEECPDETAAELLAFFGQAGAPP